jgi:hypothetical protein
MQSKLHLGLFALCCLPAFAQIDSSALRAKFGAPLKRETFRMPAGFDLIVDYGTMGQVCKLEVPAVMPHENAKVWNITVQKQRMYDFLADLVPAAMRGKEVMRLYEQFGLPSQMTTEYENVTVSEIQNDAEPEDGTITIKFKNAGCQTP